MLSLMIRFHQSGAMPSSLVHPSNSIATESNEVSSIPLAAARGSIHSFVENELMMNVIVHAIVDRSTDVLLL